MTAKRIDANQPEIVRALREVGATVHLTHMVAGGFVDAVVGYQGRTYLVEIKDGKKRPSARKLTPFEKRFHEEWRGEPIIIIESIDDAYRMLGIGL